jgi:hypothetical protein
MDEIHSRLTVDNSQSGPRSSSATAPDEAIAGLTEADVTAAGDLTHTFHKTYRLHRGRLNRSILEVVPDSSTGLYRIAWPDIGLSEPANLTRCKQAALEWAEQHLLTEHRKMSVARRLKSLNYFWWSASLVGQNRNSDQWADGKCINCPPAEGAS